MRIKLTSTRRASCAGLFQLHDVGRSCELRPQPGMDGLADVCLLDVLLPDTITQILKLLAHCPESIIAFALSCSQAQAICSPHALLWADLCMSVLETCPQQIRHQDWSPSAWSTDSHMQLYLSLLHPYRALLQQRMWHTTRMPAGQMLVIDAQPPKLIARSVFYRTLQGQAFAHPVFLVRVPNGIKAKAQAYCCLCDAAKSLTADAVYGTECGLSGNVHAHLQFYTQSTALTPLPNSSLDSSDMQEAGMTAACRSQPDTPTVLFALACSRSCGILYCERMARWRIGQPYTDESATDGPVPSSSAAAPAPDNPGSSSLPLPDVREPIVSAWDLQQLATELDYPPSWRSSAIFRPLNLCCWLKDDAPCAAQAVGANGAAPSTASTSPQPLQPSARVHTAAVIPEQLTGLWRGSYGVHGVELVHLQLVAPGQPTGIAQQYRQAMQAALSSFQECPGGVLLHSLLKTSAPQWPPGFVHSDSLPANAQEDDAAAAAATAETPAHQSDAPAAAAAAVAASDACGHSSTSGTRSLGSCRSRGCIDAPQPQQVLLVATKLTGDRNVPAGQLTFAVDLGSSSTSGAGQQLQLPFGTYSDVVMSTQSNRPLIIKERFTGMAQVAETYFQNPRMMPVDLLVFEDPSCLGLWWKAPMDSFSLLVRLQQLP